MHHRIQLMAILVLSFVPLALAEPKHEIQIEGQTVDIFDLGRWREYRDTVRHPCTVYKPQDIARARRNIEKHAWARRALENLEKSLPGWWPDGDAFYENMIPATTPGAVVFTMCPHCEYSPAHGQYTWNPKDPDKLVCRNCETVYPNVDYPEDMVLEADATTPQRFTYYSGKSWHFYGHHIRSSWTAQIRRRKTAYMAVQAQRFAEAYALAGKLEYARTARRILLRFTEVYPDYLLHSGYGEYADLDPKLAAITAGNLPVDELNMPPNKPNRKLHPNGNSYWMCGRAADTGGEGGPIASLVIAYDLTCDAEDGDGKPLYTDGERERIERDLLLESTYLMMADPRFNNKSISNRRATAMVGACVGDPMRVRFGLEAFRHMVDTWYLHDGVPGESPAYGHMTLNGILPMSEALTGYSDPPGFTMPDGARFDDLDLYADRHYRQVWRALTETILPDLRYPAWADSYARTNLDSKFAEIIAARYPSPRSRTLLDKAYGGSADDQGSAHAMFLRDPDLSDERAPFALKSTYWPAWKTAYLRVGERGLDGTVILSSSDWGGHHHRDALNLSLYWRNQEVLTDLGYLWDSPNSNYRRRTLAHNTVLIDEQEQRTGGRLGSLHLYDGTGPIQVVEMSSNAYPQATQYRRTVVVIPFESGKGYAAVDIFRVEGGKIHDYVYHGPNNDWTLKDCEHVAANSIKLYDLQEVQRIQPKTSASPDGSWHLHWQLENGVTLTAFNFPQVNPEGEFDETPCLGQGWGSRDRADTDTRVPYIVRRRIPTEERPASCFMTVFAVADQGAGHIRPVVFGADSAGNPSTAMLEIEDNSYALTALLDTPQAPGNDTGLLLAHESHNEDADRWVYLKGSTPALAESRRIEHPTSLRAPVIEVNRTSAESSVLIEASVDEPSTLEGLTLILKTDDYQTGFPILDSEPAGESKIRIVTRRGDEGFDPIDAETAIIHFRSCAAIP